MDIGAIASIATALFSVKKESVSALYCNRLIQYFLFLLLVSSVFYAAWTFFRKKISLDLTKPWLSAPNIFLLSSYIISSLAALFIAYYMISAIVNLLFKQKIARPELLETTLALRFLTIKEGDSTANSIKVIASSVLSTIFLCCLVAIWVNGDRFNPDLPVGDGYNTWILMVLTLFSLSLAASLYYIFCKTKSSVNYKNNVAGSTQVTSFLSQNKTFSNAAGMLDVENNFQKIHILPDKLLNQLVKTITDEYPEINNQALEQDIKNMLDKHIFKEQYLSKIDEAEKLMNSKCAHWHDGLRLLCLEIERDCIKVFHSHQSTYDWVRIWPIMTRYTSFVSSSRTEPLPGLFQELESNSIFAQNKLSSRIKLHIYTCMSAAHLEFKNIVSSLSEGFVGGEIRSLLRQTEETCNDTSKTTKDLSAACAGVNKVVNNIDALTKDYMHEIVEYLGAARKEIYNNLINKAKDITTKFAEQAVDRNTESSASGNLLLMVDPLSKMVTVQNSLERVDCVTTIISEAQYVPILEHINKVANKETEAETLDFSEVASYLDEDDIIIINKFLLISKKINNCIQLANSENEGQNKYTKIKKNITEISNIVDEIAQESRPKIPEILSNITETLENFELHNYRSGDVIELFKKGQQTLNKINSFTQSAESEINECAQQAKNLLNEAQQTTVDARNVVQELKEQAGVILNKANTVLDSAEGCGQNVSNVAGQINYALGIVGSLVTGARAITYRPFGYVSSIFSER